MELNPIFGHLKNHLDLHRGLTKTTESTSLNGISISEINLKYKFFLDHIGNPIIIKK